MEGSCPTARPLSPPGSGEPARGDPRLPVIILTGFLGAGKTTCLNGFLRAPDAAHTAVLVNEFGEIDIDGAAISAGISSGSRVIALPNGCICCAVQDDLKAALLELAERRRVDPPALSRCIIETTGLADPGPIIRAIAHDPQLRQMARVVQTLAVAAADRILDQIARFPEPGRQLAIADRIFVSKVDLVTAIRRDAVMEKIKALNPLADVSEAISGKVDPEHLFKPPPTAAAELLDDRPSKAEHHHAHSVRTFSIRLGQSLDPDRFRDVMSFLIMRHAENLLRIKGLVRFAGDQRLRLISGVHDVFSSADACGAVLEHDASGAIVFIGTDLPEERIRADILSCYCGERLGEERLPASRH
jgi:G3E family GTPase